MIVPALFSSFVAVMFEATKAKAGCLACLKQYLGHCSGGQQKPFAQGPLYVVWPLSCQ